MINKLAIQLIVIFSLLTPALNPVLAQAPTDTPASISADQKEKIDDLKERVATKVAQLRSQVYKAAVGEIKSVDKDNLTLKTRQGEKKIITTEETKVFKITSGKRIAVSASSLKSGDRVVAIGSPDPQGIFVAKTILAKPLSSNFSGVIDKIDRDKITITVKNTQNNTSLIIDIELATKAQLWKKDTGFEKSGFSKLNIGDWVHINGSPTEEENRLSANRITILTGFGVTATNTPTPSVSPKPSPSITPTTSPVKKPTPTSAE